MLELKGRNNSCKVFTDLIEDKAIEELTELLNQDSIKDSKIRIMPDCHAGAGCVIGTTMTIQDKIIPNLVGVDIGCGMLCIKLKDKEIDFQMLDEVVNKYVKAGFNIRSEAHSNAKSIESDLNQLLCKEACNIDRALKSIGTLGGGNHFIEVDKDDDGNLYLVIHTGSRHLGFEVAKYYQDMAYENLKNGDKKIRVAALISKLKSEGREKDIEKELLQLEYHTVNVPKDLSYLEGTHTEEYMHDADIAQKFAQLNRKTIADIILEQANLHEEERFETIHNYIEKETKMLRKGAVSAKAGEKLLIPINMRDGSLVCIGKGNDDWNQSAPHGAGRLMSRSKAKQEVTLDDFHKSMDGIYTTSVAMSTLDESPMAYKPMDSILDNIHDTVDIERIIKPVYNFKAGE